MVKSFILLAVVIAIVGCSNPAMEAHIQREKAKFDHCVSLGGIARPGTRNGYTDSSVYGGCDFPHR